MTITDITYSTETLPKSRVKITASVSTEVMAAESEQVAEALATQVKAPGFRPGKVPKDIAMRELGPERIRAAVLETILPGLYRLVVEADKLRIIGQPTIDVQEIGAGKPLRCTIEVDVLPEVQLADYTRIRVPAEPITVTPEMAEEALISLRRERAKIAAVDRGAEKGDRIEITFTGREDGVALEQLSSQNYPFILGEGQLVPGFEDQLIGLKRGESKIFTLTLPKEKMPKDLAGKTVEFTVAVSELQSVELPEVDDQFAVSWGASSAADLKAKLQIQLEKQAADASREAQDAKILDQLLEKTTTEVPASLVTEEIARTKHDLAEQVARQGLKFEDYLLMIKQTEDSLTVQLTPQAERRVKIGLALAKVAEQEKISVSEQTDLVQVIERLRQIAEEGDNNPKEKRES